MATESAGATASAAGSSSHLMPPDASVHTRCWTARRPIGGGRRRALPGEVEQPPSNVGPFVRGPGQRAPSTASYASHASVSSRRPASQRSRVPRTTALRARAHVRSPGIAESEPHGASASAGRSPIASRCPCLGRRLAARHKVLLVRRSHAATGLPGDQSGPSRSHAALDTRVPLARSCRPAKPL